MEITKPKQKSISPFLVRQIPRWYTPVLDGGTWRTVVKNVPIAGLCMLRLINHVRSLQWSVSAKDATEGDKYAAEIEYYTSVLNGGGYSQGFDQWVDKLLQDALTMPVGGTVELLRYKPSAKIKHDGKTLAPHPVGHVAKIVNIDGATLYPTGDDRYPIVQRYSTQRVTFPANSIGRILVMPRPEIDKSGYGVAPPELVYLALRMVYAGDVYFNTLMSDAPESGILYLGNITQDDAEIWLEGFRALFSGTGSTMKIPVTYGENAPKYIPFTRPPSEMMFSENQIKYARLVAAAYGLRLSDLGLEGGEQTLAGKIRDQVSSRLTGFGVVQTFIENLINSSVLPPYLKFGFNIKDPEQQIQINRARVMALQWAKTASDAGILPPDVIRKQLHDDGLFSVDVTNIPEPVASPNGDGGPPSPDSTKNGKTGTKNGDTKELVQKELELKSPENGGRGDIKAEKSLVAASLPEVTAMMESIGVVSQSLGIGTDSAAMILSAFHSRDGRNDVSKSLKKHNDDDVLFGVLRSMQNATKSKVHAPMTLYRKYYGTSKFGDKVELIIPYGDVWYEKRSDVRGKAVASTFEPGEIVSVSRYGTGFGDPFLGEVLVTGGTVKSGEVV